MKHYHERDVMQLDEDGEYYSRHVSAMTSENLHAKWEIAAELAWRDREIDRLRGALQAVDDVLYGSFDHPKLKVDTIVPIVASALKP